MMRLTDEQRAKWAEVDAMSARCGPVPVDCPCVLCGDDNGLMTPQTDSSNAAILADVIYALHRLSGDLKPYWEKIK
jgi:hypothetical protein